MIVHRFAFLVVGLLIAGAGCEKSSDPAGATDGNTSTAPVLIALSVSLPSSTATDNCTQPAYGYTSRAKLYTFDYANSYANTSLLTASNGKWTRVLNENGVTVSVTAEKLSDGRYEWKAIWNGTDSNGKLFTNWLGWEAKASPDGKSGELKLYNSGGFTSPPTTDLSTAGTWSTASDGTVTIDFINIGSGFKLIMMTNGTTGMVTHFTMTGPDTFVASGFSASWSTPGGVATCG